VSCLQPLVLIGGAGLSSNSSLQHPDDPGLHIRLHLKASNGGLIVIRRDRAIGVASFDVGFDLEAANGGLIVVGVIPASFHV
jgi:hypothetical protein